MDDSFEEQLYPRDIAMSPTFALQRFNGMLDRYGREQVVADVRFKKAREMWITAIFLLGLKKATEGEYWCLPEYAEETPDTHGLSVASHPEKEGYRIQEKMSIEVTEWEEHASGDLAETIIRKLKGKQYPGYYVLLVFARKPGEVVDLEAVYKTLEAETGEISVSEVWVLGRHEDSPEGREHLLTQVFGGKARIEFNLTDEANDAAGQKEMVKFFRGGGDDYLIDEAHYLPLPDLE